MPPSTTVLFASPFNSPFYSGASVSDDTPWKFEVALAGRSYRIDPAQYQRNTLPLQRTAADSSTEPGEQSLDTEGSWWRSGSDWILGSGQTHFDSLGEPASNRTQFYTSTGIDGWTRHQLSLLHDTRKIRTASTANQHLLSTPAHLYTTDGVDLYFTADPSVATPSWVNSNLGSASAVSDLTTVGTTIYAAAGASGIRSTVFGATTGAAAFSAFNATGIQFANGFLIASKPGILASVDGSGVATTIYTHRDAQMEWAGIVSAPNGIYVVGNSQGRAEIYFIGISTSTGALLPPVFAGELPYGETIRCLAYYQGLMLIGTSAGLRLGTVVSGNGIQYGPLVAISGGVNAVEPQGEYCWFSWSNYSAAATGLGRVLLSRFSEPLLPAYASDLMAAAAGTVGSIATYGGRRYFSISSGGVYAEMSDYVASGQIDSGWVRFGTVERKIATSLDVRHNAMPAGAAVNASLVVDNGNVVSCGTSSDVGSLGPALPFPASQIQSEQIQVRLTMTRATVATQTPVFYRWTLRAAPVPLRTDEIIIPIMMAEVVSTDEDAGGEVFYDTLAEFQHLKQLEASRAVVTYQEGESSYLVRVDRIMVRPNKWNTDRSFFNGVIFVRLLTADR